MQARRLETYLSNLLMDVPLARGQDDARTRLDTLTNAAVCYPVFRDWRSPVMTWIDEALALCETFADTETAALLGIRRAVVLMRTDDLDGALHQLLAVDATATECAPRIRCYANATRSRVRTRRREFDLAEDAQQAAATWTVPPDDWIAILPALARGELLVERNEEEPAQRVLRAVLKQLPDEMLEERVQVLHLLGFIAISQTDSKRALHLLDAARQLVTVAAVWSEVIPIQLVVANLHLAHGHPKRAERLLTEALALCRQHQQPTWEPLVHVGLARARASRYHVSDAVEATLKAATLFAQQGNGLAYVSMISYVSRLHEQAHNFQEAYRVLALGVSIAKRLGLSGAEQLFRVQIATLRDDTLGPQRFDQMVQAMLDAHARQARACEM